MSSVNPSDTYNGYYIKHLSDLEDELKSDYKRAQQNSRDQVEELSKKYEKATRENGEAADENVNHIRDDMQSHYDSTRESDRAALEQLKRQNYDKYGRDRTNEADHWHERYDEVNRGVESERATHEKALRTQEETSNLRAEEQAKSYADRMEKAVETERASSQSAYSELTQKHRSALDGERDEAASKYAHLNQQRIDDQTDSRRRTETLIQDGQRDMDNLSRHLNESIDQRLAKDHQAGIEHEQRNAENLRNSHDLEAQGLREQLNSLLANESNAPKERAQGRAQAVRDYEGEWRDRLGAMNDSHEKEIAMLHDRSERSDKKTSETGDARMRDRDDYYTKLIARQGQETREDHNAIVNRYDSAIKEQELRGRKDREFSEARVESTLRGANEDRETALKGQAENFQKSAALQKQLDSENIAALQKQLEKRTNPNEEQDISPAVESKVRRSIVAQYAKNLSAETERNKRLADSTQSSYAGRMQNMEDEHQSTLAAREAQHQNEMHQNQAVFIEHVQDTEQQKDDALRTSSQDHDRQTDTLNRTYAQSQMRQRNDYESIIQNIKDDASTRIQSSRQEAEFSMKQQQRAFSVRENEIIREYEKKLADQKVDYESRLDDIRVQAQQANRDIERRDKQTYDDQTRAYDQRIAQTEEQHKERERYITQNFEDQLDKVKRSNALLQSKKG